MSDNIVKDTLITTVKSVSWDAWLLRWLRRSLGGFAVGANLSIVRNAQPAGCTNPLFQNGRVLHDHPFVLGSPVHVKNALHSRSEVALKVSYGLYQWRFDVRETTEIAHVSAAIIPQRVAAPWASAGLQWSPLRPQLYPDV